MALQTSGNTSLFVVGGINHPAVHSTMFGLFSASTVTRSYYTDHYSIPTTVIDTLTSKALLVEDTTPTPSYTTWLQSSSANLIWRPPTPPLTAHNAYGKYTKGRWTYGYSVSIPISGSSTESIQPSGYTTTDVSTGAYTWFDPGFRGGGEGIYPAYDSSGTETERRYPGHAGAWDGWDPEKIGGQWAAAWIPGPGRHIDQFFIVGDALARKRSSGYIEPPYYNTNLAGTKGSFFCSRWGTPASFFRFGINNYISTRAIDPIYNTLNKIARGVEPWNSNSGGSQDLHCTMWVRPVSSTIDIRAHTTPCFSTGRGGALGMSFAIEDDNMPTWTELQSILTSFTKPVNIWFKKQGIKHIAYKLKPGGVSLQDGMTLIDDMGSTWWNATTRAAAENSLSDLQDPLDPTVRSSVGHETDNFRYFETVLGDSPQLLWQYVKDNSTNTTLMDEFNSYLSLSAAADDTLFWGISSGGSHPTLRFQDRIVQQAPVKLDGDQWHNIGFYVRPLTGNYKINTESGIFVNGGLASLKQYYTDTSGLSAPSELPAREIIATSHKSTGTGEVNIGRAHIAKFVSRHVATLSESTDLSNINPAITIWPSHFTSLTQSPGVDNHIYYIEHPEGYGEHIIGGDIPTLNSQTPHTLSITKAYKQYTYPADSKLYYVRPTDLLNEIGHYYFSAPYISLLDTRLGEVYYGHNDSIAPYIHTTNINDWQNIFSSFYSFTHGDTTRGQWLHDSDLDGDKTGSFSTMDTFTQRPTGTDISAGWGFLRYGGYDHRQYNRAWENQYLGILGEVPTSLAIGFNT